MQPLGSLCVNSYSAHPLLQTRKTQNMSKTECCVEEITKKEWFGNECNEETKEKITCDVFVEKYTYSLPPPVLETVNDNNKIILEEYYAASSANASSEIEHSRTLFNIADQSNNVTVENKEEMPVNDYVTLRLFVCNALVAKYKTVWEQYYTLLTSLQETYKALEEKCQTYKQETLLTRRKTQTLMSKRRARDELITLAAMERQEMMRFSVLRDKREKRRALCDQLQLLLQVNNNSVNGKNEKYRRESDICENTSEKEISNSTKEQQKTNDMPRLSQHSVNTLSDFLTDLAKEENDLTIICIQRPIFTNSKCNIQQHNELLQQRQQNGCISVTTAASSPAAVAAFEESTIKERKGYFTFFGGATLEHLSAKPYATFVANIYRLARAARQNEWHLQLLISELREDAASMYHYNSTELDVNFNTITSTDITNEQNHERCNNSNASTMNVLEYNCQENKSSEVDLSNEKLFLQIVKDERGVGSFDDDDDDDEEEDEDDSLFLTSRSKTKAKADKQEVTAINTNSGQKQYNVANLEQSYQLKELEKRNSKQVVTNEVCCVRYAEPLLSTISANLSNEEREIQENYSAEIERQREERRKLVHEMKEKFWNTQRSKLKNAICTLTSQQHELIASLRDSGVQQIHVQWLEPCCAESCMLPGEKNINNRYNIVNYNIESTTIRFSKSNNSVSSVGIRQEEKPQSVCRANSPAMQLFEPAPVETECHEYLTWTNTPSMTFMWTPKKMTNNECKDQNSLIGEQRITSTEEHNSSSNTDAKVALTHSHEHHLTVSINENYVNNYNDKVSSKCEEMQVRHKSTHEQKQNTRISDEYNNNSRRTRFSSRSTISTSTISTTSMRSTNLPLEEEQELEEEELEKEEKQMEIEVELKEESNSKSKEEKKNTVSRMMTNVENMKSKFRNTIDRFSMRATQLNEITRTSSELCSAVPLCRMKQQNTQNSETAESANVKSFITHARRQTVENITNTNSTTGTINNIKSKTREKENKSYYIQLESNVDIVAKSNNNNNNNNNNNKMIKRSEECTLCHCNHAAAPVSAASMANVSITYNGPAAHQRQLCKLQNEEEAKEVWRLREELARIEENNYVQEHHLQSLEKTRVEEQQRRKERLREAENKLVEQENLVESFRHERKKWICILNSYQRKLKRRSANEHVREKRFWPMKIKKFNKEQ